MTTTDLLAKIFQLGPPLKATNNNYWAKKIKRFYDGVNKRSYKDCKSFSNNMEYKEALRQATNDLKSKNSKSAFKDMKRLTKCQSSSSILYSKVGNLKGKFAKDLKDQLLMNEKDIGHETQAYLEDHYKVHSQPSQVIGECI